MNIKSVLSYLARALSQPSGTVGIIGLLTLLGIEISPEQSETIQSFGIALASLIAAFIEW